MLRTVCAPVWGISVPGYRKGAGGTRVNTGPATGNNNGVQGYTKLYPMLGGRLGWVWVRVGYKPTEARL